MFVADGGIFDIVVDIVASSCLIGNYVLCLHNSPINYSCVGECIV